MPLLPVNSLGEPADGTGLIAARLIVADQPEARNGAWRGGGREVELTPAGVRLRPAAGELRPPAGLWSGTHIVTALSADSAWPPGRLRTVSLRPTGLRPARTRWRAP